jgi:hypothetical protein
MYSGPQQPHMVYQAVYSLCYFLGVSVCIPGGQPHNQNNLPVYPECMSVLTPLQPRRIHAAVRHARAVSCLGK